MAKIRRKQRTILPRLSVGRYTWHGFFETSCFASVLSYCRVPKSTSPPTHWVRWRVPLPRGISSSTSRLPHRVSGTRFHPNCSRNSSSTRISLSFAYVLPGAKLATSWHRTASTRNADCASNCRSSSRETFDLKSQSVTRRTYVEEQQTLASLMFARCWRKSQLRLCALFFRLFA